MTPRHAVVEEARRWLDTPFAHQASLHGVGCDCIGLIVGVVHALGLKEASDIRADPRFKGYGPLPNGNDLAAGCAQYAEPISVKDAGVGDILLMTFLHEPMHVAIISRRILGQAAYIIHAYQPAGKVVENVLDEKWRRRIVSAHRLRGVG